MAEKKGFRAGLYAVLTAIIMAVVLSGITFYAYTSRYTAFSAEKTAVAFVDTVVQKGDGYNAYKNTLVSKNSKYGDFIINAYMKPYVHTNDENGKEIEQAAFVGTGTKEEQQAIDKVYNDMYVFYCALLEKYGWDNYDEFFNQYFAKLVEVRKQYYNDDYMDTEFMFGALESNVDTYGKNMTGVEGQKAEQGKAEIKAIEGEYQKKYGKNYRFTTTVKEINEFSDGDVKNYVEEYKGRIAPVAESGEAKADKFGLVDETEGKKKKTPKTDMIEAFKKLDCSESISGVTRVVCEVKLDDGTVVAEQEAYLVKIGRSWYVDNTNINTANLYLANQ